MSAAQATRPRGRWATTPAGARPVFDAFADGFDHWAASFGLERYDYFVGHLPPRVRVVLDVGCGTGILAAHLADHVGRVVGVDVSTRMLAIARRRRSERGQQNIDLVVGRAEALPFPDASFDCVVSTAALYNTDLDASVPELRRVVRPGGRIVLSDTFHRHPALDQQRAWAVVKALKSLPGHAARLGVSTAWRLFAFRTSPMYLAHNVQPRLTPVELAAAYRRLLPGCRIDPRRWDLCVCWDAVG